MSETKISKKELVKRGFIQGLSWSFGVTIGFILISTILAFVLTQLGGLPLIGGWIADIIQSAQEQLIRRTPGTFPQ